MASAFSSSPTASHNSPHTTSSSSTPGSHFPLHHRRLPPPSQAAAPSQPVRPVCVCVCVNRNERKEAVLRSLAWQSTLIVSKNPSAPSQRNKNVWQSKGKQVPNHLAAEVCSFSLCGLCSCLCLCFIFPPSSQPRKSLHTHTHTHTHTLSLSLSLPSLSLSLPPSLSPTSQWPG